MTKKIPLLFLLFLTFFLPQAMAQERKVIDPTGRQVLVPAHPQRVVSLAPSITEMVFSLGRGELLQGTTNFSNYPPAARHIPQVGSFVHPDLERIVALRPDLVLATRDGNPRHLVERLTKMGIAVFVIDPRNFAEIRVSFRALGQILNAAPQAEELAGAMAQRLNLLGQTIATAKQRPLVFFQVGINPIVSVGEQSFLHELIILAGGRNAAADGPPYPRLSWEDILRRQPEIVVISSMTGLQSPDDLRRAWERWPQLMAVQRQRIYVVDVDLFNRPTLRLLDGLETLAQIIHPDLFPAAPAAGIE